MDERTSKILCIVIISVMAAIIFSTCVVFIVTVNGPSSYDKVDFDVDQEDLQSFKDEKDHDISGIWSEGVIELCIRYALSEDDRDGDGYSTLQACVDSLKKECPSDWTMPEFILVYLNQKYQCVPDSQQYPSDNWAVYPTELLSSKKGDCEDFAILTAALLDRLGYSCGIVLFSGHVAAIVADDIDVSDVIPGYNAVTVEHDGKTYYIIDAPWGGRLGYTTEKYTSEDIITVRFNSA